MSGIAPNEATRDRILANHIYRQVSNTISTAQEYIASEKLYDVYTGGKYDLIVLDTPPMKNALDFLESPNRMVRFLDDKIIRWFVAPIEEKTLEPRPIRKRLFKSTGAVAYKLLGYVFGDEFLNDLNEFFVNFKEMTDVLQVRSEGVGKILRDQGTSFLIVCSPRWSSVQDAMHFSKQLRQRHLSEAGLIVNQVRSYGTEPVSSEQVLSTEEQRWLKEYEPTLGTILPRLEHNYRWFYHRSEEDRRSIAELRKIGGGKGVFRIVPRMLNEISDIPGLIQLNDHLFPNFNWQG